MRGVSQFVAAALLVVIVVTTGFFLSQWYSNMVKTQTEDYEKKYEESKACSNIKYSYFDVKFNETGNDYFSMYVKNEGDVITLINGVVFGTNGNVQELTNNYVLPSKTTKQIRFWINISHIGGIDLISFNIKECGDKVLNVYGEEIV